MYVKDVYIEGTSEPNLKLLEEYYSLSYAQVFGSFDNSTDEFADGYDLIVKWFKRVEKDGTFDGVKVISCEVKRSFDLPTSIGPIPFNYIWDRFDYLGNGRYKVVDYKTNRWNINLDQFKKKIQPRAYAMAAAIQLKSEGIDYDRIYVEFDMLRHSPIGMMFTREDNKNFWNFLKTTVEERIIAIPDTDANGEPVELPERLNPECLFCVRKSACKALKKNIVVGGIHSLGFDEAIDLRAQVNYQQAGLNSLANELDAKIETIAKETEVVDYQTSNTKLSWSVSNRRGIDGERVKFIIGTRLFEKYGSESITMKSIDTLLKGPELNDTQKKELRGMITNNPGTPKIKLEPVNMIDDD